MPGRRGALGARWIVALVTAVGAAGLGLATSAQPAADAASDEATGGSAGLDALELRGRAIYRRGIDPEAGDGQRIMALMGGAEGIEVPAAALPCASCHGRDGRGRPEGGVLPSDITWPTLTRPYTVERLGGRTHPPYTEESLVRAISLGIDPAGNELDPTMPRYRLSRGDAEALVSYMRRLGAEPEPGVTDDRVVLATLVPREPLEPVARAVRGVLEAYFAERNEAGGVYGRSIELVAVEAGASRGATRARLERLLETDPPFALVAPMLEGLDEEVLEVAAEHELPIIGALSSRPFGGTRPVPPPRYAFYLMSGLADQARALAVWAGSARRPAEEGAEATEVAPWAMLAPRPPPGAEDRALPVVEAVVDESRRQRVPEVSVGRFSSGAHDAAAFVRRFQDTGADTLVLLGDAHEGSRILTEAERAGWRPRVLLPSAGPLRALLGEGGAVPYYGGTLAVALPLLPDSISLDPATAEDLERLTRAGVAEAAPSVVRRSALASAELATEALRRVGRELTRERLVDELETFRDVATGYVSAVTFDPNRRIGARGAHVVVSEVTEDGRRIPLEPVGWVAVD